MTVILIHILPGPSRLDLRQSNHKVLRQHRGAVRPIRAFKIWLVFAECMNMYVKMERVTHSSTVHPMMQSAEVAIEEWSYQGNLVQDLKYQGGAKLSKIGRKIGEISFVLNPEALKSAQRHHFKRLTFATTYYQGENVTTSSDWFNKLLDRLFWLNFAIFMQSNTNDKLKPGFQKKLATSCKSRCSDPELRCSELDWVPDKILSNKTCMHQFQLSQNLYTEITSPTLESHTSATMQQMAKQQDLTAMPS